MSVDDVAGHPPMPDSGTSPRQAPPGPGDLGRRAAWLREELGLSTQQVAERAAMSVPYLEYLEHCPAQPTEAAIIRLAEALQTTPPILLGAAVDLPPGRGRPAGRRALRRLDPAECRRLLAPGGVGRVAYTSAAGPAVLPVNFALASGTVVFRTGQDTVLAAHSDEDVGFEVDHLDEAQAQGWSVLVLGRAHRVTEPAELRALKASIAIWPWAGGDREIYVRIVPTQVSGRRILPS